MKGKNLSFLFLSNGDNIVYCSMIFPRQMALYWGALDEKLKMHLQQFPLDTLANVAQAGVFRTNKCMEVKRHNFEHLL